MSTTYTCQRHGQHVAPSGGSSCPWCEHPDGHRLFRRGQELEQRAATWGGRAIDDEGVAEHYRAEARGYMSPGNPRARRARDEADKAASRAATSRRRQREARRELDEVYRTVGLTPPVELVESLGGTPAGEPSPEVKAEPVAAVKVGEYTVDIYVGHDGDGLAFLQLGGRDCKLTGEEPGLYYPEAPDADEVIKDIADGQGAPGWCHVCNRDISAVGDHAPGCEASDRGPDHPEVKPDPAAEGSLVELTENVERYPHFIARAGLTGRVVEATADLVRVRMDDPLPGSEEWDNEVCWAPEDDPATLAGPVRGDAQAAAREQLRVVAWT